ncbi:MAG: dihydroneopterin aldolase [Chromatiales bacterium]|nr:dihydroneopterin aldolase [Chromatiales bacterium]
MDKIFLKELKLEATIGVFAWERQIRQVLYADLEMAADIGTAAQSDKLDDTLDYKSIAKYIQSFVARSEYQLIETLANDLANSLVEEFNIRWLRLDLNKTGAIRGAQGVGVSIERGSH